ncbi:MAG TPA: outer membrane lipoprotein-sorting protein [Flavobacterium sp.]|jgi:outer membrane lipoprotein-sorting protein|nr:outer membrane lipoprotein-sorting protein [Bacteroidales bacterium]HRZ31297.1 outer membrane lipoprotein-sorting protein [Flavobacterium sp.]HRZ74222.1 outer membrane lipoprotein-sorting protein [Flavobacterium sp.]
MKSRFQTAVITAIIVAGGVFSANAQDASTILKKMDDVMYSPKDMIGNNKIILIDKNGKEETREATVQQKGNDKRMFRFTSPASQAGISVLSLPNDVMYLYLPAFGKERRIATSAKNQNFAGTDFSYDDMESVLFSVKYTPKLVKTEDNVFVLELTPVGGKSDYSKVMVQVNKTDYYPELMEYYDKGNTKVKEAKYTFKKIGNYWNAAEIEMTDLKKNHKTKMQMSDVKYDMGLTDDDFTVRKLKQ